MEDWQYKLMQIGGVTSLFMTYLVVTKLWEWINAFILVSYPDFKKYGKWAVVTGSTEGIGNRYAHELASRGCNIVIISLGDVEGVAKELESKYGVETKHLEVDFSQEGEENYDKITELVKDLDVGILVNNVGIGCTSLFLEVPNRKEFLNKAININIKPTFKITSLVLPGMVERKRGLIINVSSFLSMRPTIGFAVYGSTKAFVTYFTETIRMEHAKDGIDVQLVLPSSVNTAMATHMKVPKISVKDYVSGALATVTKQHKTHGCLRHSIEVWGATNMPEKMWTYGGEVLIGWVKGWQKQGGEESKKAS